MGGEYYPRSKFVEPIPNQIQQIQIPKQVFVEHTEQPTWHDNVYAFVKDNVPDWFIVTSLIVGAITLGLVVIKFSPLGKILGSLFSMWANFLRRK